MAVYRLHRKEWEKGNRQLVKARESGKKRKRHKTDDEDGSEGEEVKSDFPGGGRKGVSSGLTTIVRRGVNSQTRGTRGGSTGEKKSKWWKELASGSKGTLKLQAG